MAQDNFPLTALNGKGRISRLGGGQRKAES
jgi:hypothetical protein